jgi:hypothetical protein
MAFRWRVVKDYDMITRRKTLRRQKDAGESYRREWFYGQNQLARGFQVSI